MPYQNTKTVLIYQKTEIIFSYKNIEVVKTYQNTKIYLTYQYIKITVTRHSGTIVDVFRLKHYTLLSSIDSYPASPRKIDPEESSAVERAPFGGQKLL